MLDGDSVSVLQIENKAAERSLADETLNLGSNDGSFHRDNPSHVCFWASWQDHCLATRRIGPAESYQESGAELGVVAGRSGFRSPSKGAYWMRVGEKLAPMTPDMGFR